MRLFRKKAGKAPALFFFFSAALLSAEKITFPVRSLVTAEEDAVPVETEWDERWFGENPAEIYNHGIARIAAILAAVSYEDKETDKETNLLRQCYRALGIPQELIEMHYDIDYDDPVLGNNQAAFSFASRQIQSSSGKQPLVFVAIRGTPLSANEWISNINISDTTHTDNEYHEGFLKTTSTVKNALIAYLFKHKIDIENCYLLITGHSRGAAIANLLAMQLGDSRLFNTDNIYAYTFASPNVTTDINADDVRYGFIWNIVNAEDIVPSVPPNYKEWRYTKYGRTKVIANEWNKDPDRYEQTYLPAMNIYFRQFMHRDYCPFTTGPFVPSQVSMILTGINKNVYSFYNGIRSLHSKAAAAFWRVFPPKTEKERAAAAESMENTDEKDNSIIDEKSMQEVQKADKTNKQGALFSALTKWCYRNFGVDAGYILNCFSDMHAMETYLSWIMSADEDELYSEIGTNLILFKGSGDYAVIDSSGNTVASILDGNVDFSKIKTPVAANSLLQGQVSIGIPSNQNLKIVASKESIFPTQLKVSIQHFDAAGVYLGETKSVSIYPYNRRIYECEAEGQSLDLNNIDFAKATGKEARIARKASGLENKTSFKLRGELSLSTSGTFNAGIHTGSNIFYGTVLLGHNAVKMGRSLELSPGIGHQSILVGRLLLDTQIFSNFFYAVSDEIEDGTRLNLVPSARFSLSFKPRLRIQLFAALNLELHISDFNDTAFDNSYRVKATGQTKTVSSKLHTVPNFSFGIKF